TSGAVVVDGKPYKTVEHYAGLYENSLADAMGQDD
ncbi:MAG: hypothetical protein RLZZ335_767, partial [Bacteroidota bacterium]